MNEDIRALVGIAEEAARRAGVFCRREYGRVSAKDHQAKGPNDFFTYVDVRAEEIIIEHIQKYCPGHAILAEESGASEGEGDSAFVWHIDPVDGTNNYIHRIPFYAVSIGISHRNVPVGGVIFAPEQNELFRASDGGGAFLNNRRIRVATTGNLAEATVAFGFPHRDREITERNFDRVRPALSRAGAVRRCGSAALDLAWLACGRFDGYLEFGLQKHDIAAGIVIVRESGGLVSAPRDKEDCFESGDVVAGTEQVHNQILHSLAG